MAYRTSSWGGGLGGFAMTPWVRRLLIANTAVFVAVFLLERLARVPIGAWLAFEPRAFLWKPWSVLTYSFVHAGLWHLLGNLLVLFFFGPPLEDRWGSRDFIKFYLVAVAGGALFSTLFYPLQPALAIVGASAATFGLMLAFAMIWPDMPIYIWGVFPLKAKWLVAILAAINVLMLADAGSGGGVAVLAHLGGLATAFAYLKSPWGPRGWGNVPSAPRKRKPGGVSLVPWGGKQEKETARTPTRATVRTARAATAGRKAESRAERELLDDVDRILDKISEKGLASLTEDERRRLDEVSRLYRTN